MKNEIIYSLLAIIFFTQSLFSELSQEEIARSSDLIVVVNVKSSKVLFTPQKAKDIDELNKITSNEVSVYDGVVVQSIKGGLKTGDEIKFLNIYHSFSMISNNNDYILYLKSFDKFEYTELLPKLDLLVDKGSYYLSNDKSDVLLFETRNHMVENNMHKGLFVDLYPRYVNAATLFKKLGYGQLLLPPNETEMFDSLSLTFAGIITLVVIFFGIVFRRKMSKA